MNDQQLKLVLLTSINSAFQTRLAEEIAKIETVDFNHVVFWAPKSSGTSRLKKNLRKHGPIYIPWRLGRMVSAFLRNTILARFSRAFLSPEKTEDLFEKCRELGIKVHVVENLHEPEGIDLVSSLQCDLIAVCGTGILRKSVFTLPAVGTINLHQGEVPKYRGAPPGFWELRNNEQRAGVTIHFIDEGVDTGDVILQETVPIFAYDSLETLQNKLSEISIPLYTRAIAQIAEGSHERRRQQSGGGRQFYLPTLNQKFALALSMRLRRFNLRQQLRSAAKLSAFPFLLALILLRDTYFIRVRKKKILSIIYYHRVTDICSDGMTVRPKDFEKQVRLITKNCTILSPSGIAPWLKSPAAGKAVLLSFDDGYLDNSTNALPILKKYDCPGVIFVSTGLIGTLTQFDHDRDIQPDLSFRIMNWEQLQECKDNGVDIGIHSHSHRNLAEIGYDEAVREIDLSIDHYRKHFGGDPSLMSYPFGARKDITTGIIRYIRDHTPVTMLFSAYGNKNISRRQGDGESLEMYDLKRVNIGAGERNLLVFLYKLEGTLDTLRNPYESIAPPFQEHEGTPAKGPVQGERGRAV